MLGDDGRALLYLPILNYADGNLDAVARDARRTPTPSRASPTAARTSAPSATPASRPRCSTHWVRDRDARRAARRCRSSCTADAATPRAPSACSTAACWRPGYKADINVIDLERLALRPPEMSFDLPGGGRRLLQRAEGYRHTIVSGAEVYRDGEPTGALPGRLVRGAQPAPAA